MKYWQDEYLQKLTESEPFGGYKVQLRENEQIKFKNEIEYGKQAQNKLLIRLSSIDNSILTIKYYPQAGKLPYSYTRQIKEGEEDKGPQIYNKLKNNLRSISIGNRKNLDKDIDFNPQIQNMLQQDNWIRSKDPISQTDWNNSEKEIAQNEGQQKLKLDTSKGIDSKVLDNLESRTNSDPDANWGGKVWN